MSSDSTRRVVDNALRLLASAVDDRVISSSPCHDDEVTVPTLEEVQAMANAVGDRWRALVVTLAGSGLRIGEALGLQVSDVDFLRRTIRVERPDRWPPLRERDR